MQNILELVSGQRIAVTGASGYIGSALIHKLARQSSSLLAVSRSAQSFGTGINFLQADIRNSDAWTEIAKWADVIFHLAGNTSANAAASDPAESLRSTVLPVAHLVRAASEYGRRPRVIFASTATVYGLTPDTPVDETHPTNPVTVYDLHKLFAERQLAMATQQGILDGVALRLANVYGPSMGASSAKDRGILNKVTEMALLGKDITIFGDGKYLRDYVYIDDVVQAFLCAGFKERVSTGPFNVATGLSVSVRYAFEMVASQVKQTCGRTVRLVDAPWPQGTSEIELRGYRANIRRVAAELGWMPQTSLKSGVNGIIEYLNGMRTNGQ